MSFVRKVVAITWAAILGASGASAEPPSAQHKLLERIQAAYEKAEHQDCQSSLDIVKIMVGQKEFTTLPEPARAGVFEMASVCAMEVKDTEAAYRYALDGTRLKAEGARLWRIRLWLELEGERHAQAVKTVEAIALQSPETLNGLPIQWLSALYRSLRQQPDRALQRRLLEMLTAPSYQPDELLATGDSFKREYAAMLVDAGDKASAAALVARIGLPAVLVDVSVDPRLRSFLPTDFDARVVVERHLAQVRETAASHAGSMAVVLEVTRYLRQLGRAEEALATLEAARPDGAQGETFADLDEQRNWWWDEMARTYEALGRYDDAVVAFREGIDAKENGGLNVSQTINLGHAHLRFDHPAEALATVAAFEADGYSTSPYGAMELRLVRGCAHLATGQATEASGDIAYASAHERDHPEALMDLLLCAGDMDGAAAALIRRLDDPDRRIEALLQLSDYDAPPASYPQVPFEARLPALKARPDVQAAIMRAGGVRRFRLQAGEM